MEGQVSLSQQMYICTYFLSANTGAVDTTAIGNLGKKRIKANLRNKCKLVIVIVWCDVCR